MQNIPPSLLILLLLSVGLTFFFGSLIVNIIASRVNFRAGLNTLILAAITFGILTVLCGWLLTSTETSFYLYYVVVLGSIGLSLLMIALIIRVPTKASKYTPLKASERYPSTGSLPHALFVEFHTGTKNFADFLEDLEIREEEYQRNRLKTIESPTKEDENYPFNQEGRKAGCGAGSFLLLLLFILGVGSIELDKNIKGPSNPLSPTQNQSILLISAYDISKSALDYPPASPTAICSLITKELIDKDEILPIVFAEEDLTVLRSIKGESLGEIERHCSKISSYLPKISTLQGGPFPNIPLRSIVNFLTSRHKENSKLVLIIMTLQAAESGQSHSLYNLNSLDYLLEEVAKEKAFFLLITSDLFKDKFVESIDSSEVASSLYKRMRVCSFNTASSCIKRAFAEVRTPK